MSAITREKLQQAAALAAKSNADAWIVFVRETSGGGDPCLPLILEGGLTWISALLVTRSGKRVAIVGNYDADPLRHSGDWDEVIPYVQGIREPLWEFVATNGIGRIAANFSLSDDKSDGLTHGMWLLLRELLPEVEIVSAEEIVGELRSVKTPGELACIRSAIAEGDRIFADIASTVHLGMSERALYNQVHAWMRERGLGFAWDEAGDPIVNFGPDSMIGHGIPSDSILLAEGQILHVDLGVIKDGYSSDIQRVWYVGDSVPDDCQHAFDAVNRAISAGAAVLRPGVPGHQVDAAARASLVADGYPEYLHALGHQVGLMAHDGGGTLGPQWERYGNTPNLPVKAGQVYTLELGITVPGRGYIGIEEMAVVTETGVQWLSERQLSLPALKF